MAEHKLSRIHYLRASKTAAKLAAERNLCRNRFKPSERGRAAWYNLNTHEGYGGFQQFLNGHHFHVP